jgi:hypothetical protein
MPWPQVAECNMIKTKQKHSADSIQLSSISATAYVQRSAIEYIQGVKATALLFIASVSMQKPSAHFIAMAEMVVRSA